MKNLPIVLWITSLVFIPMNALFAFDTAKEQRIAEQTIEALFDGEPIWLKTKQAQQSEQGKQFLALLTEGAPDKATIVLVHGTGQGPNTPFVIAPLREIFTELNYTTLSLQMPVLSNDKAPEDYVVELNEASARLSVGLSYLKNSGATGVYMVAHSLGSSMMMNWAASNDTAGLDALVALGFGGIIGFDAQTSVQKLKLPLLDVIGEHDYESIVASAPARSKLVTATNQHSAQANIEGADHFYNGKEKELVDLIDSWFSSLEN